MTLTQPRDVLPTIFQDANHIYVQSIERLKQGDLRDAAEKAWCAVNRATTALVLARLGEVASKSPFVTRGLARLAHDDPANFQELLNTYFACQNMLHGECFYWGLVEQPDWVEARIREVSGFIVEAELLAGVVLASTTGRFHRPDCRVAKPQLNAEFNWSWHWDPLRWTWYPSAQTARGAGKILADCCVDG